MRQKLIDHVNSVLAPIGFKKRDDNFVLEFDNKIPGGGMYVNGQYHKIPDQVSHYMFAVKLLGPGSVSDDKVCEEFECIEFTVRGTQEGERSVVVGVYYKQVTEFNEYLKTYFGL